MSASQGRSILADVLTSSYRIVGKITIPRTGLIGLLNDDTSSIMEVHEASMARLDQPKKLVERYRVIRVVKDRLFGVSLGRRDDVGSMAWARGGYGVQREFPVHLVSSVFEMWGLFEWSERFDLHAIMVEGTPDFLPLFDVKLNTTLLPSIRLETPAMLFNRRQMEAMALLHGTTAELSAE